MNRWGCGYSGTLGESRLDKTGNMEKESRAGGEQNQAGPLRPSLSSLEEWRKGVGTPSAGGCLQMVLKLERRWL